jgi:hypothetical protein
MQGRKTEFGIKRIGSKSWEYSLVTQLISAHWRLWVQSLALKKERKNTTRLKMERHSPVSQG